MSSVINVAAVVDNRILVDGLRAWASGVPEVRLTAVTTTVDELLRATVARSDVVLLDAHLSRA